MENFIAAVELFSFFLKICISFKTGLPCEGHTDKSQWVSSSCHFITFMLKHPSEFGGQSGALFCWSVCLCQNMQSQKNVSVVEAQGHLMSGLKCQSIPGSVCGWLSMWQIFFKKKLLLKTCHYGLKSAAQLVSVATGCTKSWGDELELRFYRAHSKLQKKKD